MRAIRTNAVGSLLLSPLIAALAYGLLLMSVFRDVKAGIYAASFALLFGYISLALVGVPLFFVLRKLTSPTLLVCLCAGAVTPSVAVSLLLAWAVAGKGLTDMVAFSSAASFPLIEAAAAGGVGGLTFWVLCGRHLPRG